MKRTKMKTSDPEYSLELATQENTQMTVEQTKPEEQPTTGEETAIEIVSTIKSSDLDLVFNKLDKLEEAKSLISLTPRYIKFEDHPKGTAFRGVIASTAEIPSQNGGTTTAIVWVDAQGNTCCNASKLLVDTLLNQPVGTAFQVVYEGKQKSGSGNYFNKLTISLLNL